MIRILLAEDTNMVRGALVALLDREEDLEVVAEVDRGDLVEGVAVKVQPDVAILDVDMPGMTGIDAAARLKEVVPTCRCLLLTSLSHPATVRRALSVQIGGFLLKDAPSQLLAESVRRVARGERVIDPELALAAWDTGENPLTPREIEVLRLAARGASVGDIAKELFLSAGTVRNYLTMIVSKLNAQNRLHAVRLAEEAGWLM